MVDKVTAIARSKLGERVGTLSTPQMEAVDRALLIIMGLA